MVAPGGRGYVVTGTTGAASRRLQEEAQCPGDRRQPQGTDGEGYPYRSKVRSMRTASFSNPTPRRWLIGVLAILAAVLIAGCTGGGPAGTVTTAVDQAIAWISGLVTKSRGEPISGATVSLEETGERTTTDGQGRFHLGTTRRGDNTLRSEAGGYLTLRWPVSIENSGTANLQLRLVTMQDYSAPLFRDLTGASDIAGTWRWNQPVISYYVNRNGPYRPEFDAPLREAFTQWSMLTQRAITFTEGNSSAAVQISFVSNAPCGFANAAGCAGPTRVSGSGVITGALIELHSRYATDVGLAVHEVGHVLAFTGHSPTTTDVMYYQMNSATSPSNAEAAVASVLYSNPAGTTALNVRLPGTQMAPAAVLAGAAPRSAIPAPEAVYAAPSYGAVIGITEMIRGWFASLVCATGLPGACPSTPWVLPR